MPGVQRITGRAVAVNRANIDTDQIIPASWLKRVERTGFEAGLFGAWRSDPDFPLNRPGAAGARILVAGDNFGCGSSREHAVWALQNFGFEAVVAPGFADIFRGNAISSGLVPAQASADAVAAVFAALEADPDAEVTVDVAGLAVEVPSAGLTGPGFAPGEVSCNNGPGSSVAALACRETHKLSMELIYVPDRVYQVLLIT